MNKIKLFLLLILSIYLAFCGKNNDTFKDETNIIGSIQLNSSLSFAPSLIGYSLPYSPAGQYKVQLIKYTGEIFGETIANDSGIFKFSEVTANTKYLIKAYKGNRVLRSFVEQVIENKTNNADTVNYTTTAIIKMIEKN